MGRGRAKAKQAKVARALKYHSPNTDLAALQRELGRADSDAKVRADDYVDEDPDDEDPDDGDLDDDEDLDEGASAHDDGTWATRP